MDKEPGQPCPYLQQDFRCSIHQGLRERGLKGCSSFDCFGAGQKVSQITFKNIDWKSNPESAEQMFKAFLIMRQLHEMLWYLREALTLEAAGVIHEDLGAMDEKIQKLTMLVPAKLFQLNVSTLRSEVSPLLDRTFELAGNKADKSKKGSLRKNNFIGADLKGRELSGINFKGACLIAADLKGAKAEGTNFLGADLRDADLRGADLRGSLFLTQAQLNVARGDFQTKIPPRLNRPEHWINN